MKIQEDLIESFRQIASGKQWTIVGQRDIDHAIQFYIQRGTDKAHISFYTKGTILVQGKQDSQLRKELLQWSDQKRIQKPKQQFLSLWDE